jgi:CheY-like chemotaxis protein
MARRRGDRRRCAETFDASSPIRACCTATKPAFVCYGGMGPSNRKPVVLVVEDEPILRELSVLELEEAGYTVLEAGNAHAALWIMRSRRGVGLIFTDINMPGKMDGLDLARIVHDHWPHVKVIVTTGAGLLPEETPEGGLFLAKPYSLSELSQTVDGLTHGSDAQAADPG